MGWIEFWDNGTPIYVNDHHKRVHYRRLAEEFVALLPSKRCRVLDYGCGEALSADAVVANCTSLVLCDAAPNVRTGLKARFAANDRIHVRAPEDVSRMDAASFDVIFANSVIQYMQYQQLAPLFSDFHRLLSPNGLLILGDVIPPDVGILTDTAALLRFASREGFLIPAGIGLLRTVFSDYRRNRAALGLLQLGEAEIIDRLRSCGFDAKRAARNIGHNNARMTVVATRAEPAGITR